MKKNNRFIAVLTGLTLVVAGIVGAIAFVETKPEAQRSKAMSSMVPVVETMLLEVSSRAMVVDGLGSVIADKSATMKSEVSGRIVAVSDTLVEGELVKKGDVLMEIDAAKYLLDVAAAEADVLNAQSDLRLEEGNQAVARHELSLIGGDVDEAYKDLILRTPQLKSAQAAVMSAQAALDIAKLDVARTKIRAPFDAVIVEVNADVGDFASTSTDLIELAAINRYFIRAAVPLHALIPLSKLGKEPYEATLMLSDGSQYFAQTFKLLPDLTDTGRMAQLLLVVESPYKTAGRPLLLNEMIRFRIQGDIADRVSLLPRKYLRDGDVIWMIDSENKLHILPAEVLMGYADEVLVRVEGAEKLELVKTDLPAAVEGMQLRLVGESSSLADENKPAGDNQGAAQ